MTQELKNDLIASWNDTEEAVTSLLELNADDLLECRFAIAERLNRVRDLLGKYVTEEDIIKEI